MNRFVVFSVSGFALAATAAIVCLMAIWRALVLWTYSDARRRIADANLVGWATVAALIPFLGTLCYLILRPPEFLDDVHEREVSLAAAEASLVDAQSRRCESCGGAIEADFLRCPTCLTPLRTPCTTCNRPVDFRWVVCPYCDTELRPLAGEDPAKKPRSRRRGRREIPSS